jgi:hypothetical protein
MFNRKRGAWMNFDDAPRGSVRVARIQPGCISTSTAVLANVVPVITNGKIGSVNDTVTISPQTAQVASERRQA